MYKHYVITIKEKDKSKPITTEMQGDYDTDYIIDFLGLTDEDIEWWKIDEK